MRDGKFATMMQQQEEEEAQKLMEKEQRAMPSTPTGKDLLLIQHVISLQNFILSSIPQNLVVASKATTLATDNIFSLRIAYSIYKRYLESPEKIPLRK